MCRQVATSASLKLLYCDTFLRNILTIGLFLEVGSVLSCVPLVCLGLLMLCCVGYMLGTTMLFEFLRRVVKIIVLYFFL